MDCPTINTPLKIYDNDGTLGIDYAYLTFVCTQAGGISLTNYGGNIPNVEYKKNNDAWTTWDYSNITMAVGDRVCMRGLNPNGFCYNATKYSNFVMTGSINASGNIMSLIDKTGSIKEIPQVPSCFCRLFKNCASLKTCCQLPATTLADGCYYNMFRDCTSLVNAPSVLPATSLAVYCCYYMFIKCTKLTTAPLIAGKTHKTLSYDNMFDGCTKLNYVKCLLENPDEMASDSNWLRNVSSTGTFVKKAGVTWSRRSEHGIPANWTVEEVEA